MLYFLDVLKILLMFAELCIFKSWNLADSWKIFKNIVLSSDDIPADKKTLQRRRKNVLISVSKTS